MKKLFVVVMLLFLIGCSKGTVTMKDAIFEFPNFEYDVCTDDCETDFRVFETYFDVYWNNLSVLQDKLAPNRNNEALSFVSGEYYSQDDLVHDDPITKNTVVDLEYPYERFTYSLEFAQVISQACSIGESGCYFWYGERNFSLTNLSFGFNDSAGYFSAHVVANPGYSFDGFFWFGFMNDGTVDFEYQYYSSSDNFLYESMTKGIYRSYQYAFVDNIEIHYINLNSKEAFIYNMDEGDVLISYLEEASGFYYYYYPALNFLSVAKYDDMEYVAGVDYINNSYTLNVNFYMMDGWDQIQYLGLLPVNLYNQGNEVYNDYTVRLNYTMPGYPSLVGSILLEDNELSNYEFPASFSGGIPYSVLYQKYVDFQNLEDAVEITGITSAQIQNFEETVLSHIKLS